MIRKIINGSFLDLAKTRKILLSNRGEGYIDVIVMILCAMLVISVAISVFPAYIAKQKLDTFATEIMREAEIAGRIGSETSTEEKRLQESLGISPTLTWSHNGNVQLNHEMSVTATLTVDIGIFGEIGSFPVTLQSKAIGKSEVYYKGG